MLIHTNTFAEANSNTTPRRIETYRGVVHGCDCDLMGHLNTVRYAAIFDSATWTMLRHLGYRWTREAQAGWADIRNVFEYKQEIPVDAVIFVESNISRLGKTSLTLHHELQYEDALHPGGAARGEVVLVRFDLRERRPDPHPDDFRLAVLPFIAHSNGPQASGASRNGDNIS